MGRRSVFVMYLLVLNNMKKFKSQQTISFILRIRYAQGTESVQQTFDLYYLIHNTPHGSVARIVQIVVHNSCNAINLNSHIERHTLTGYTPRSQCKYENFIFKTLKATPSK